MMSRRLFLGYTTPEDSTKKAGFKVCGRLLWALFSLYCLYTGCFQASSKRFAHMGAERQTNIHTYIHAHTHFS